MKRGKITATWITNIASAMLNVEGLCETDVQLMHVRSKCSDEHVSCEISLLLLLLLLSNNALIRQPFSQQCRALSLYIKRGTVSVTVGVANSVANDVTMTIAGLGSIEIWRLATCGHGFHRSSSSDFS